MRRVGWVWMLLGLACGSTGASKDAKPVGNAKPVEAKPVVEALPPAAAKPVPGKPGPKDASEATAENSSDRAVILAGGSLMRLAPSGATEVLTKTDGANACQFDESHRVVWLASDTTLRAYDPRDGRVHEVAMDIPRSDTGLHWQIQRPATGSPFAEVTASNVSGIDACVSLVVSVATDPRLGGEIIAEGDREWYCFADDDDVGKDRKDQTLSTEEAAVKARYDSAKLSGKSFLVSLAQRVAKEGPLQRTALAAPATPHPVVDPKACEENEADCGKAKYLGGQRLWEVITSNSRGDFYYETTAVYDSKTASWWDPATDKHTKNLDEVDGSGVVPSPDGTWGTYAGKIVSLTEAKVTGAFPGTLCGWE